MKIVEHQSVTAIVMVDNEGSEGELKFSTEACKAYLNAVMNGNGSTFDVTGVIPDTKYEHGDSYEETKDLIDEIMIAAVLLGHEHVIKQIVEKYPKLLKAADPMNHRSDILTWVLYKNDLSTLKILMEKFPGQIMIGEMANHAILPEDREDMQPEEVKFYEAAQALAKVYATKPSASKSQQSFFKAKDEEVSTEASVGLAHSL